MMKKCGGVAGAEPRLRIWACGFDSRHLHILIIENLRVLAKITIFAV